MNKTAVVTGHTSGLGYHITNALLANGWDVIGLSHGDGPPPTRGLPGGLESFRGDVTDADDIWQITNDLKDRPLDALINCAGVNWLTRFTDLASHDWERVMDTNAKALWVMTQALLPHLQRTADRDEGGTVLNIVSNAAHMPMTHSLAYNASKAAALMITLQMARELYKSHGVTVFAISPNKLAGTAMSRFIEERVPALRGWTAEEAAAYQRAALPIGEETDPEVVAEFIGFLLSAKYRHRSLHGCNIPYGA